jgi:hypothetical protein
MKSFFTFCLILTTTILSQEHGLGLLLDEKLYENAPAAARLMRGDYINLPSSVSLKQFTPDPGNQGVYSTCAGWASSYYARTVLEAMKKGWDNSTINKNAFSPSFIYNQVKKTKDCSGGVSLDDALQILKNIGDLKLSDFGYSCKREVQKEDVNSAQNYKIIEYRFLGYHDTLNVISCIKKSLAESKPVIVGFGCPPSFLTTKKELWIPNPGEYKDWQHCGHALTVIGYDDNKFGGAFEIVNSWGTDWGNKGFIWIKYSDFKYFYVLAYEIIDKRNADTNAVDLSGSLLFKESNGNVMRSKFNGKYFVMEDPYYSGTLFELRISNNEAAYVYAFSSDLTNKIYKIFPNGEKILPYLPYRQNNVAIPDEDSWNVLDTTKGKTYFCFLYSMENLNLDEILNRIRNEEGTLSERIEKVLGDKIVEPANIEFKYSDEIKFAAKSKGKIVVPVLIELNHF